MRNWCLNLGFILQKLEVKLYSKITQLVHSLKIQCIFNSLCFMISNAFLNLYCAILSLIRCTKAQCSFLKPLFYIRDFGIIFKDKQYVLNSTQNLTHTQIDSNLLRFNVVCQSRLLSHWFLRFFGLWFKNVCLGFLHSYLS